MTEKRKISFGDLVIGETAKKNFEKIFSKNWVSEGPLVKEFEQKFATKFGYKYAIATSSGTDACICACTSLYDFGANRGDEIITPALSFVATANAILASGFVPVFVDISLDSKNFLNIDPNKIEDVITTKTRAINVVHTMGKPAMMDEIKEIADKYGLRILEDSCEAHGALYKGKYVGTIGDIGAFSFYTAHQIVCGEGGMVVTNDDKIADIVRSVKSHGRPFGSLYFDFQRVGYNSKTTEFAAALGLEGLEQFDEHFNKRKSNLNRLLDLTKENRLDKYCHFINEDKENEFISPHAFPILIKEKYRNVQTESGLQNTRDVLYKYLELNGIQTKTLFGSLPTQHNCFKFLNYKLGQFPLSEYVGSAGLHFGCHQWMSHGDIDYIIMVLKKFFNDNFHEL